jgi:fatty-acyl-CoA synthase
VADPIGEIARLLRRLPTEAQALATIVGSGLVGPERADRLYAMYRVLDRYGPLGGAIGATAVRHGGRTAIVDDAGALTYEEMDRRSNALAHAWRARGAARRPLGVAVMCRNHRGSFDASFGALKAGCRVLYMNTDFAPPQAKEVCAREGVDIVVYDEEFSEVVASVDAPGGRYVAWTDNPVSCPEPTLDGLIRTGNPDEPPPPAQAGQVVILTSGTTGTPKGANRSQPRSLAPVAAILSRIPFRAREVTAVAPPVYHAWGLGTSTLALGLGSTLLLRRRFDPEATLVSVAEHRASALIVVPVLLKRILALGADRIGELDLSALRIIASSGSALDAPLARRTLEVFGDVLYNLYGSTEVAWATIATPEDLRAEPGCAGRPPLGTTVRILDEEGRPVPAGRTGRIFVGSGMEFGGYTGGGSKEVVDGLMSTGDVGHFDLAGRLFVDGREDEMIVSGGENVFPREVEDLLAGHDAILEAAAVGVDDDEFGQRLRAFVVLRPGHRLDEEEVKAFVRANLARYKVPREVVFLDALPRNSSGKVLKRQLIAATGDGA